MSETRIRTMPKTVLIKIEDAGDGTNYLAAFPGSDLLDVADLKLSARKRTLIALSEH